MNAAMKGASSGAAIGSIFPGPGTVIGGVVGAGAGMLMEHLSDENTPTEANYVPNRNVGYAMGGDMNSYSNGGEMFSEIDAGGTHEQNPRGGVPMPNNASVEEGETKMGSRVFSNRLINPATGNTFADDSKMYVDSKRPNDPISKRFTEKQLNELFEVQESMKPKQPQQEGQVQMSLGGDLDLIGGMGATGYYPGMIEPFGIEDVPSIEAKEYDMSIPEVNTSLKMAQPTLAQEALKSSPNATPESDSQNLDEGAAFSPLRYAPLLGDATNIAMGLANKPEEKDLDMFSVKDRLTPNLVNRDQVLRDIESSAGATRELLPDATRGNAGAYLNNLQGLSLNTGKAVANASLASNIADAQERSRVDSANMNLDLSNQRSRMQVANMNDADKAAYLNNMMDSTANLAQNIGNIGTEQTNKNIVNELFGYDIHGQYKMLKESGQTKLSFKDWLKQLNK